MGNDKPGQRKAGRARAAATRPRRALRLPHERAGSEGAAAGAAATASMGGERLRRAVLELMLGFHKVESERREVFDNMHKVPHALHFRPDRTQSVERWCDTWLISDAEIAAKILRVQAARRKRERELESKKIKFVRLTVKSGWYVSNALIPEDLLPPSMPDQVKYEHPHEVPLEMGVILIGTRIANPWVAEGDLDQERLEDLMEYENKEPVIDYTPRQIHVTVPTEWKHFNIMYEVSVSSDDEGEESGEEEEPFDELNYSII